MTPSGLAIWAYIASLVGIAFGHWLSRSWQFKRGAGVDTGPVPASGGNKMMDSIAEIECCVVCGEVFPLRYCSEFPDNDGALQSCCPEGDLSIVNAEA